MIQIDITDPEYEVIRKSEEKNPFYEYYIALRSTETYQNGESKEEFMLKVDKKVYNSVSLGRRVTIDICDAIGNAAPAPMNTGELVELIITEGRKQ